MKVSELEGPALDYWVAKACGWLELNDLNFEEMSLQLWEEGLASDVFSPSTRWEDGGPIIDREGIATEPVPRYRGKWGAKASPWRDEYDAIGPTVLIAAMRCFCCDKFGEEVPD